MAFEKVIISKSEDEYNKQLIQTLKKFFKLRKNDISVLEFLMNQEQVRGTVPVVKVDIMEECGIVTHNTVTSCLEKLEMNGIIEKVPRTRAYVLNDSLFDKGGAEFILRIRA